MPESDRGWQSVLIGGRPDRTLVRVGILVVVGSVLWLTAKFILTPVRIVGPSMEPTCRSGQIKWVNRLAYRWSAPQRGDVVAIQGNDLRCLYWKRVIGLPGEMIAITDGTVVINGVPLAEPYAGQREGWNVPPTHLREDQYLVIGDNRAMHQVIHLFGTVERSQIVGRMLGER